MSWLGVWGAPEWAATAGVMLAVALATLLWATWRSGGDGSVRLASILLKTAAFCALALCLVDPLLSGVRPRRGANIFAVVVDDSQSLQIRDPGAPANRGETLRRALLADTPWQTRLGQDFDVRRLAFSSQLRAVDDFSQLAYQGGGTSIAAALSALSRRFRGLPVAGVLLMTDGNATDAAAADFPWSELPPIYPVAIGGAGALRDVSVERVAASQTNFETAPVTIRADIRAADWGDAPIVVRLEDERGKTVDSQTVRPQADCDLASVRFQLRPERSGVCFYSVTAAAEGASAPAAGGDPKDLEAALRASGEATLANNRRLVSVDRGGGPYRVLYVSGRPNWEFKFLRRSLDGDDQLKLVGLVRIAKREPKFSFRDRETQNNLLFEGFDHPEDDAAESYDEPVLVRLNTDDEFELRDGFPRAADELYRYNALVLDDLEAAFFTQDQLTLIEDFVSRRGGGLLMLGGAESFVEGNYRRTPVGDALPVYLDKLAETPPPGSDAYRLALSREGWLEPWVRLRKTEPEDRTRLAMMQPFQVLNGVGRLKPGAAVLAHVIDDMGENRPALVAQRYGRGRSAAVLIGDLWRWGLKRRDDSDEDLEKSWRQTIRWLVSDVPQRVEIDVRPADLAAGDDGTAAAAGAAPGAMVIEVAVRDPKYLPLDNAVVKVQVDAPGGRKISLDAEPSASHPGVYVASLVPREPGAYRATVSAVAPDGAAVGQREAGWAAQPLADEFNRLTPNRDLLAELAAKTGGSVVEFDDLDRFVATLDARKAPITEPWTRPLWHQPLFFLVTIGCLVLEWGLRRWKGLA